MRSFTGVWQLSRLKTLQIVQQRVCKSFNEQVTGLFYPTYPLTTQNGRDKEGQIGTKKGTKKENMTK